VAEADVQELGLLMTGGTGGLPLEVAPALPGVPGA